MPFFKRVFDARFIPLFCNQLLGLFLGVIAVKLFSGLVPPAIYGSYALFITLTQLGSLLTHSGLSNHATRYWQREQLHRESYLQFLWQRSIKGLFYLMPVLLTISVGLYFSQKNAIWLWIFPLLFFSNTGNALYGISSGILNASNRLWVFFFLSTAAGLTRTLLPIVLVVLAGASLFSLAGGFALHSLIVTACIFTIFRTKTNSSEPAKDPCHLRWLQELKDYGRPYIWLGVGGWLLVAADRWVVLYFFGEERAGLFALATNLAGVIPSIAATALLQWAFPSIFRAADSATHHQDWQKISQRCDHLTLVFVCGSTIGLLLLGETGRFLVGWLINPKYADALILLVPAGLAVVSVQVNQFYYLLLQGQHNSAGMVKVMAIVSLTKTGGSIIAAFISWEIFLVWLILSMFVSLLLGRTMIHKIVFRKQ